MRASISRRTAKSQFQLCLGFTKDELYHVRRCLPGADKDLYATYGLFVDHKSKTVTLTLNFNVASMGRKLTTISRAGPVYKSALSISLNTLHDTFQPVKRKMIKLVPTIDGKKLTVNLPWAWTQPESEQGTLPLPLPDRYHLASKTREHVANVRCAVNLLREAVAEARHAGHELRYRINPDSGELEVTLATLKVL